MLDPRHKILGMVMIGKTLPAQNQNIDIFIPQIFSHNWSPFLFSSQLENLFSLYLGWKKFSCADKK